MDYVRVYQRKGQTNIGCNPARFPTSDYIDRHMDAYTSMSLLECSTSIWDYSLTHSFTSIDPNISYWTKVPDGITGAAAGYSWPKESLVRIFVLPSFPRTM